MAALGLDDDELKSVELVMHRLAQLSSSIQSLKMDILKSNPLPPTSSLQASAQILQRNLQSVLSSLTNNTGLFTRIAVHPSTNFPGRTQENVLTQLLRKKLEPDVEELVAQGRETARLATPEGVAELQDIWEELREWTIGRKLPDGRMDPPGRIAEYVLEEADDPYTAEEREAGVETVRTGLKRDLEEDDEEDEEEDAESKDEDEEPRGLPRGPEPETLLWFATRGDFDIPRNVEFERKRDLKRGLDGVNIPPEPMQGVDPSAS